MIQNMKCQGDRFQREERNLTKERVLKCASPAQNINNFSSRSVNCSSIITENRWQQMCSLALPHRPQQGLNSHTAEFAPLKEWSLGLRAEMRHSVLRRLAEQVFRCQIFSVAGDFMSPISFVFFIARKVIKSFMVMTISCDYQKLL